MDLRWTVLKWLRGRQPPRPGSEEHLRPDSACLEVEVNHIVVAEELVAILLGLKSIANTVQMSLSSICAS